jgi:hypothetical protein
VCRHSGLGVKPFVYEEICPAGSGIGPTRYLLDPPLRTVILDPRREVPVANVRSCVTHQLVCRVHHDVPVTSAKRCVIYISKTGSSTRW